MSRDPQHPGSGPAETDLVERVEVLLDEAVGQAAKGSYRDAADKAQQALAMDPGNTAARELLDSYRRQFADDDERRRRRRSIAAAAAAIEEMVESDRLDEAANATDALALQFGADAPVDELQRRIAESRAAALDFDELDADIDAIRRPEGDSTQPPGRLDAAGMLAVEIEEHLRSGRLDEASRAIGRLESEPGTEERARKLRVRIEEALHVAEERRREEEILIATAAIEDRLRRGSIDEAAQRIDLLAARHGASAPVAELSERLAQARAQAADESEAATAGVDRDAEPAGTRAGAGVTVWESMAAEESRGQRRGRWLAIAAAAAILIGGGGWWLSQRSRAATEVSNANASAAATREGDALPTGDAGVATAADGATSSAAEPAAPSAIGRELPLEGRAPSAGADGGSRESVPAGSDRTAAGPAAPAPARAGVPQRQPPAPPSPPADIQEPARAASTGATSSTLTADQRAAAEVPPAARGVEAAPEAPAAAPASSSSESVPPPSDTPGGAQVEVDAVPATEAPPVIASPAPVEASPSESAASDSPAATSDTAAPPAGSRPTEASAPEPAAPVEAQRAGDQGAPRTAAASAPAATTGPALLACGDPGVVCLKSLQVPTPSYPAAARARRLSADVVVMALVDERGRVIQTHIDRGSFPFFNESAIEAAKRAVFQPATRDGVPGRSWARLTFRFDQP